MALSFSFALACTYVFLCRPQLWEASPEQASRFSLPANGIFNTVLFLLNRERFLRGLLTRISSSPVFIGICGYGVYVGLPGRQAHDLLRSSHLVPCPSLSDALTNFFGLPKGDLRIFDHDHISSFESTTTLKTNHPEPSRRIISHQRKDFVLYFHGRRLRAIVERFLANLVSSLREDARPSDQPTQIPDIYRFLSRHIFRAEVRALYGENVFAACPSFSEDFFRFYEAFPTIADGLPRWLEPSSYRARDTMISHFRAWRANCLCRSDPCKDQRRVCDYEPVWGSACIRNMVKTHEDLGFSEDGIASVMLGYLFVTMANSIPATLWMLFYILLDEGLASRVDAEISGAFSVQSGLDVEKLVVLPLLNSIYRETLRLRTGGTVGRRRTDGEITSGGITVRRNTPVMLPHWLAGQCTSFWGSGAVLGDRIQRPVGEFWAERFLVGGPADHQRNVSTTALRGYWFPFGGGPSSCPGEDLAKHMILSSVAAFRMTCQIQLTDPAAAQKVGSHSSTLPFGSHDFDSDVPCAIRPRHASPER